VIHDRDIIYSEDVDTTLAAMGLTVLKTPVRPPQANAFCERLVGTIRRECLDFMIPGPLVDDTIGHVSGHRLPSDYRITATAILGDLHHEYRLEPKAA
jgi:hypothetical protein